MWIRELSNLGWKVLTFSSRVNISGNYILKKIKKRFSFGAEYRAMRFKLIELCEYEKPDWIHFRLPIEFDVFTLKKIKKIVPLMTEYFNDDPFSNKSPFGLNWRFRSLIHLYDINFTYRKKNLIDFKKMGAKEVYHLPPMYDPLTKFKVDNKNNDSNGYMADAAFIGHWENDQRVEFLSKVITCGYSLLLHGSNWEKGIKNTPLKKLLPVKSLFGNDYNRIYSNVIAGICFFSKINHDTFTERALEIIATGGVLVCERTDEAMSHFTDGVDALFFETPEELVNHIKLLKKRPDIRKKIQISGYSKLINGQFTIFDRVKFLDNLVNKKFVEHR